MHTSPGKPPHSHLPQTIRLALHKMSDYRRHRSEQKRDLRIYTSFLNLFDRSGARFSASGERLVRRLLANSSRKPGGPPGSGHVTSVSCDALTASSG